MSKAALGAVDELEARALLVRDQLGVVQLDSAGAGGLAHHGADLVVVLARRDDTDFVVYFGLPGGIGGGGRGGFGEGVAILL